MKRILLVAALLAGCTPYLPRYPDEERSIGRERFIARCSGCHSLPDPRDRRPDEWHVCLADMGPRAKLSLDERRAVERYLAAAATR